MSKGGRRRVEGVGGQPSPSLWLVRPVALRQAKRTDEVSVGSPWSVVCLTFNAQPSMLKFRQRSESRRAVGGGSSVAKPSAVARPMADRMDDRDSLLPTSMGTCVCPRFWRVIRRQTEAKEKGAGAEAGGDTENGRTVNRAAVNWSGMVPLSPLQPGAGPHGSPHRAREPRNEAGHQSQDGLQELTLLVLRATILPPCP